MTPDALRRPEFDEIEVELPRELLDDIDDYAVTHGYQSPSDVVQAALEQ
jgi:Arc/MetJ-type ribon-helix-helix transcriptional regulator